MKLNPAETSFPALTLKSLQEAYVMFGMKSKENLVVGMVNLSIMDDKGSEKLICDLNRPNGE